MERADLSWSEEVAYICRCGLSFRATRHRWIDVQAQRERRDQVLRAGPIEGTCPSCGRSAAGRCSWVELLVREKKAVLVLGAHQRAELNDELIAHLQRASRFEGSLESWILRPDWRFEEQLAEPQRAGAGASAVPMPLGGTEAWPAAPSVASASSGARDKVKDAFVAQLHFGDKGAGVDLCLNDDARRMLSSAALRVRPCLLRLSDGYPVLSLRIIASYLGQTSVIDAVSDPGVASTFDAFEGLIKDFRVRLQIRADSSPEGRGLCREVAGVGLDRNLKFCLDSALEALNNPAVRRPGLFDESKVQLAKMGSKARLAAAKHPLSAGAFQHLLMPKETRRALLELDAASHRENLRHLLEVDGLGVEEYEEIRERVLASSFEQGLCAPSRFWPRIVKLGLAPDYTAYAQQLAENRQRIESSGVDDLSGEDAQLARKEILSLCEAKGVSLPPVLEAYLRGDAEPTSGGSVSGAGGVGAGGPSRPVAAVVGGDEDWDALANIDLFFEANLLENDEAEFAALSDEAIDDDMDRLFPRPGLQANVEFMAETPEAPKKSPPVAASSKPRPPQPPTPRKPPPSPPALPRKN